jgi:hypothetical protein
VQSGARSGPTSVFGALEGVGTYRLNISVKNG